MRPRVFPAEDPALPTHQSILQVGFNEAAGIPRGRRCQETRYHQTSPASMRPRVFPAEDAPDAPPQTGGDVRFNEAAGIPRGRRAESSANRPPTIRFNEAAGIPRGRQEGHRTVRSLQAASMRPRVFPAEDSPNALRRVRVNYASMRPRVFPAEDPEFSASPTPTVQSFNEAAGIPRRRR